MSGALSVSFTKREQALLRLASGRIRRLVRQLDEQERMLRETLIERDRLSAKIIRMEVEARMASLRVVEPTVDDREKVPLVAALLLSRLAPQRLGEAA